MKTGDKKFVMTILMMCLMEGEIFILCEEIFVCFNARCAEDA